MLAVALSRQAAKCEVRTIAKPAALPGPTDVLRHVGRRCAAPRGDVDVEDMHARHAWMGGTNRSSRRRFVKESGPGVGGWECSRPMCFLASASTFEAFQSGWSSAKARHRARNFLSRIRGFNCNSPPVILLLRRTARRKSSQARPAIRDGWRTRSPEPPLAPVRYFTLWAWATDPPCRSSRPDIRWNCKVRKGDKPRNAGRSSYFFLAGAETRVQGNAQRKNLARHSNQKLTPASVKVTNPTGKANLRIPGATRSVRPRFVTEPNEKARAAKA